MSMTPHAQQVVLQAYFTGASGLYLALHTGDPGDGGDNELTDANYVRRAVAFTSPDNTAGAYRVSNDAAINFPALAGSATITWMSIKDASTSGNTLATIPLLTAKSFSAGGVPSIAIGDAVVIGA